VPSVRLLDYIDDRIDFLKLDIEGSEVEVLLDCKERLDLVDHLFVELHSYVNRRQRLDEMLSVLVESGFRYHIQPELVSERPFLTRYNDNGMDQRLNIFAYRSYSGAH